MWERVTKPPIVVGTAIAYGSLLVFLRATPTTSADAGIFLSVIGRLLDGDRLYVDVFDNKDPLFFYTGALAVHAVGWKGLFVLDAVWLAVAAVSTGGLLRAVGLGQSVVAAGFIAYPLLLTGGWYFSGFSMLAALTLAPLVGWLWARQEWFWAGVVAGVALGFKLNLAAVLVAVPIALLFVPLRPYRRPRAVATALAGAGIVVVALGAILAVRGELGGYLAAVRDNFTYAKHVLPYTGRQGGVAGHLRVVAEESQHTLQVVAAIAAGACVAIWIVWRQRNGRSTPLAVLAAIVLTATAATAVTLGLTAAWVHHLQMLAYPESLLVAFTVACVSQRITQSHVRKAAAGAACVLVLWIFGSWDASPADSGPRSRWWTSASQESADALEDVGRRFVPDSTRVDYARLGRDDDDGHALFLERRFDLVCPRFHQHLHTEDLDGIVRCIAGRQPSLVFVGAGLTEEPESPRWSAFVRSARSLLSRRYTPVLRRETARGGPLAIWRLRLGRESPGT